MKNRLYHADCRTITGGLVGEGVKVDLIYLGPPFNSNRIHSMLFQHEGTNAQQKACDDMWDFTDKMRQLMIDSRAEFKKWDDEAWRDEFVIPMPRGCSGKIRTKETERIMTHISALSVASLVRVE